MIGGQGEDSCGKSGTDETPQERKRRGGSSAARGKQQRCNKRHTELFIPFVRLWIDVVNVSNPFERVFSANNIRYLNRRWLLYNVLLEGSVKKEPYLPRLEA
ncbi:hypothetical protein [Priestia megaterium]|uniref:hypothetical protein n=1 Tax=Priestia megaterium TaxID=1404 RepID=UPI0013C2DD7B|nr:hypothetical protein [Priestia megaterium]MCM3195232.1 hypothetical protein [Priestia megaterium]